MDIFLNTSNPEFKEFLKTYKSPYRSSLNSLTRDFYYLINNAIYSGSASILAQIEKITKISLAPIYQISDYRDLFDFEEFGSKYLKGNELELKRLEIIQQNAALENNITVILDILNQLIQTLSNIPNLIEYISEIPTKKDFIQYYFSNFNNLALSYTFGYDLRKFRAYVELAHYYGEHMVYFTVE